MLLRSIWQRINAGHKGHAPGPTNRDGNPRLASGTVGIGAYEFPGHGSLPLAGAKFSKISRIGFPDFPLYCVKAARSVRKAGNVCRDLS